MTNAFRAITLLGALLALSGAGGCTFTRSGTKLPQTEPTEPTFRPRVEHTVANFGFAWGDAELKTSTVDGRLLGGEIMDAWKERGYAIGGQFQSKGFSGQADYTLTLTGSQRNVASFSLELLNALTLTIIPYTVTQRYDLAYVLEDVKSGKQYHASVQGWDLTYVSVLAVPALPFAAWGHRATMEQMGDSLYEQFRRQGAFECPCPPPAQSP